MPQSFMFTDRVFIITGSTKGIGYATAELLAAAGASVVISSRKAENCQQALESIQSTGGSALAVPCHVGSEEQLQNLIERTVDHFGRLDGLVCNAASNPVYGPSSKVDYSAFELIMRNNVYSAQRLAALAAGHLPPGGSIVLISSIAGLMGSRLIGTYGLSKSAEMQLVRNLALELGGQGIRVNGVAPGLIETDFSKALMSNQALLDKIKSDSALGRVGQPQDIARVVAFLLSDAAGYVTGQTIIADGGTTIADPF